MRYLLLVFILFTANVFAQAPQPDLVKLSPELEVRIKKLETELRCLVCQNQTLADSPAGLAGDLRRELRSLMVAGKTDGEIKDFLQIPHSRLCKDLSFLHMSRLTNRHSEQKVGGGTFIFS